MDKEAAAARQAGQSDSTAAGADAETQSSMYQRTLAAFEKSQVRDRFVAVLICVVTYLSIGVRARQKHVRLCGRLHRHSDHRRRIRHWHVPLAVGCRRKSRHLGWPPCVKRTCVLLCIPGCILRRFHSSVAALWPVRLRRCLACTCVCVCIACASHWLRVVCTCSYRVFVLEEAFGFNEQTWQTYFGDLLKSSLLSALIGLPITCLLITIIQSTGDYFWLYVAAHTLASTLASVCQPRFPCVGSAGSSCLLWCCS